MTQELWIGRAPSSPDPDYALFTGGSLRGTAFAPVTQNLWGVSFRYRAGRSGGSTPAARAALYQISGGVPGARMGHSTQVNLSTLMSDANSGEWVESPVASVDGGPTNAAIPIPANTRPLLSLLVTGASAHVGMIAAARIEGHDENFYDRSGLSQPPPNPYGSASASIQGNLTIGLRCHVNEKPVAPAGRSLGETAGSSDPDAPAAISTQTPTYAFDHRDRNGPWGEGNNGANVGDYMNQARIEVQVKSGSSWTTVWQTTQTASPAQRASERFSMLSPVTLTRGSVYRWRCQTSDHFGEWGLWSSYLYFTPANLGLMTVAGTPTGKQETNTPGPFQLTWSHQGGLATNAVQIALYRNGALSQLGPVITKTIASGATGNVTWAETTFPTLLWGQNYSYRARGRDTNGVWSEYSPQRAFTTNSPPGIPDGLSPSNSEIVTNRPILTAIATDADDTPATGLVVKFRIKDSGGTVLQTRDATYNAVTGRWEYQTTSSDLASFGTFKFDAYSYDGTLYSGAKTVEANADKSAESVFVYADGPQVAITSPAPAEVLTSSTPTVTWTAATQNRYRVRVYRPGTNTVVYERSWVTSPGTKSWTIPAGWLRNHSAYEIEVGAEDTTPLQGFSPRIAVTTDYTPPDDPVGVVAVPVAVGSDPWPTAILVQAEPSTIDPALFVKRQIYRHDITDRPYRELFSPSDTAFLDDTPASGVDYTYTWRDVAYVDTSHTEQIESDGVETTASVELRGVVLSSVQEPERLRAYLTSVQERSRRKVQAKERISTWGKRRPTTYWGTSEYEELSGVFRLHHDAAATAIQREAELEALIDAQQTLCYRDERGRRVFVTIDDSEIADARIQRSDVTLRFIQEHHIDGVTEAEA